MVDLAIQEIIHKKSEINQNNAFYALDNSVGDGRFLFSFHSRWNEMEFNDIELFLHGLDINVKSVAKCLLLKDGLPAESKDKFDFKEGNALIGYCAPPIFHETENNLDSINRFYSMDPDLALETDAKA